MRKIKLSKHRVFARMEDKGLTKADLRDQFGITIQGIYYRFREGWTYPEAGFLAMLLGCTIKDIEIKTK